MELKDFMLGLLFLYMIMLFDFIKPHDEPPQEQEEVITESVVDKDDAH